MEFSKEIVRDIASYLDCGLVCYLNITTKEVHHFVDPDDMVDIDDEMIREMAVIDSNSTDFIRFEKMESREAYMIMERFTSSIEPSAFRDELINSLEKRGPFRAFRNVLECDADMLQKWYDFKKESYESYVRECIELTED